MVLFLGMLCGTGLVDAVAPVPLPREQPAEVARLLERSEDGGFRDGSLARRAETLLRLRSRVRRAVAEPYATALFHLFGELSKETLRGDGMWLFDRERTVPPPGSPARLARVAAAVLLAVQHRVEGLGLACAFLPVPRKSVVCRAHLPPGVDPDVEWDRAVFRALRERGVHATDVLAALEAADDPLLFYPCDTHWTPGAQRCAVEATLAAVGWLAPVDARTTRIVETTAPTPPGLFGLLARDGVRVEGALLAALQEEGTLRLRVVPLRGAARLPSEGDPSEPTQVDVERGRLALCGTSFSDNRSMPALVGHFAQTTVQRSAISASAFLEPLQLHLAERRAPENERVLVEFPLHQLFFESTPTGRFVLPAPVGRLFAEQAPPACPPLAGAPAPALSVEPGTWTTLPGGRTTLATLPPLPTSADTEVRPALEVRAEVEGGPLELRLETGACVLTAPWPTNATHVVLPLLAPDPTSPAHLDVLAPAGTRLRVEAVRAVHE